MPAASRPHTSTRSSAACGWVALALTLSLLRYGEHGKRRLVVVTLVPAYMNWLVTVVKSFLHVKGVDVTGDGANNAVFAALNATVVVPSFGSAIAWLYGFYGTAKN